MYMPPRSRSFLTSCFADTSTESISIKTPMAQGLIESISAVVITTPRVGRYASTATYVTSLDGYPIRFAYFVSRVLFPVKFYDYAVSWRNVYVGRKNVILCIIELDLLVYESGLRYGAWIRYPVKECLKLAFLAVARLAVAHFNVSAVSAKHEMPVRQLASRKLKKMMQACFIVAYQYPFNVYPVVAVLVNFRASHPVRQPGRVYKVKLCSAVPYFKISMPVDRRSGLGNHVGVNGPGCKIEGYADGYCNEQPHHYLLRPVLRLLSVCHARSSQKQQGRKPCAAREGEVKSHKARFLSIVGE